jgi:hypothetical protein
VPDQAAGPVTVGSAFAVPFGRIRLRPCELLNQRLEQLFLARESDEYRNPTPSHVPQSELFESRFNLFTWPDPCVQELRRFVLDGVVQTVLAATSSTFEDLAQWKFQNHTWFHITRFAGSFVAHNHPLASWSAVYCVRAGESQAYPSGVLRFFDPRGAANGYLDHGNAHMRAPYAPRPVELQLSPGELVIFPSYVFHEVTPFYGHDFRITVATNCWFI